MTDFDPVDWYWFVGGEETRVWSSARGRYYQVSNADYRAWLAAGGEATRIATDAELSEVLRAYGLSGPFAAPSDVHAERDRRLALGFDYDFGDERGVHHIATTPGDMIGWQDVTTWATVQAVTGNAAATLDIKTETGPATITAADWFAVLNAATAFRQPIWAASFVLEAMQSIPLEFADDKHWRPAA